MTRRVIDRLGAMSYGILVWGIINGSIQRDVSHETRESLPVLIPLIAVNLVGVIALFYCLASFIGHLFTKNKRLRGAGKALWLILLLLGSVVTMPIYWYMYIVRERLPDVEQSSSALRAAHSATGTLA
jgi:uncharacterized membrane protein YhaH (DUF805 family)